MEASSGIDYRYERKYRLSGLSKAWLEQMIRLHPAGFRTLYPERRVNNIYFDTADFSAYRLNVIGAPHRRKYRLRWYGDVAALQHPVLEVKIKNAELGYKEHYPQPDSQWSGLPHLLRHLPALREQALQPVMVNRYRRNYWGSADGRFRITVDDSLQFAAYRPGCAPHFLLSDDALILELKYAAEDDADAQHIFAGLPFRQTKNSKYVTGVNLLYY